LGVEEPLTLTPAELHRHNEVGYLFSIDIVSPIEIAEIRCWPVKEQSHSSSYRTQLNLRERRGGSFLEH